MQSTFFAEPHCALKIGETSALSGKTNYIYVFKFITPKTLLVTELCNRTRNLRTVPTRVLDSICEARVPREEGRKRPELCRIFLVIPLKFPIRDPARLDEGTCRIRAVGKDIIYRRTLLDPDSNKCLQSKDREAPTKTLTSSIFQPLSRIGNVSLVSTRCFLSYPVR